MRRAAIYTRISSDPTGEQLGVSRQLQDCRELAHRRGWEVAVEHVDDDVSAYNARTRPAYRELLRDIREQTVDAVVVWHLDRLHRQPKELEEFFEACDGAGLTLLASVSGDTDLASDDGRFAARILGAVARKESDDKSRRIRRKAAELASRGKVAGGGTRPFGYESDRLTIRPAEAAIIRDAAKRVLAGESVRSVCADLNRRDVPTVTGSPWRTQTMRRMLKSGRISGQRDYHGEIVAQAEWPAVITPAQTTRLRALLNDPSRRTNRTARRYLLTRLLRCDLCGERLVARPRDDGRRRYVCASGPDFSGCGKLYVVADELEALIVEAVLYRLDTPELASGLRAGLASPDVQPHQDEIEAASAHLDELAAAYGARQITMSEWLTARKPIEDRLSRAKTELAKHDRATILDGFVGHADQLRERWTGLPLSRQSTIVGALLDHAVIGPGRRGFNRFDPQRVRPVWRV